MALIKIGIADNKVREILSALDLFFSNQDYLGAWQMLSKKVLRPSIPFEEHQRLFELVYGNSGLEPAPCWVPAENEKRTSNVARLQQKLGMANYSDLHCWAVKNREAFWEKMISLLNIRFQSPPKKMLTGNSFKSPKWMMRPLCTGKLLLSSILVPNTAV